MRKLKKSEYVLSGILSLLALSPIASDSLTLLPGDTFISNLTAATIDRRILLHREDFRTQRRTFAEARALCVKRQGLGEDVECPDFNDPAAVKAFIRVGIPAKKAATQTGETVQETVRLRLQDLSENQRLQLRRFDRRNTCPETLRDYLPGFYELCLSFITKDATRGFINDRATIRRNTTTRE